jgi:hypothetical protein
MTSESVSDLKGISFPLKAMLQRFVVLYNPVMHNGDFAASRKVGMGVGLVDNPVGSPSRMAYPVAVYPQRVSTADRRLTILPNV